MTFSPPVHQQRDWRHLQRATVSAFPVLGAMAQRHFCAHLSPAASIAVWILQHRPELAMRRELHVMVANATEFKALDSGRWLQFIPWLLGRPNLQVRTTIVGESLVQGDAVAATPARAVTEDLEIRLRSLSWSLVRDRPPAELHEGTLKTWRDQDACRLDPQCIPDLCAIFSPAFSEHHDVLLSAAGLLPLLRAQVPLALFSPSQAEQMVDAYTLKSFGMDLLAQESWPNPWALPAAGPEREGSYARWGWAAEFSSVPSILSPGERPLLELEDALDYVRNLLDDHGDDAFITLGEPLRAVALSGEPSDSKSLLLRLPRDVAVDLSSGYLYQLQDVTALLLESLPMIPIEALQSFPGHDDLVRRAVWAVSLHRAHVAPFVQPLNEALRSQFSALDEAEEAATSTRPRYAPALRMT